MLQELISAEVVALADRCVDRQHFQGLVLAQLARVAGYDSAIFLPVAAESCAATAGRPAAFVERYREQQHHYNRELQRAHRVGRELGAYLDTDVYSLAERERMSFFGDIIRPQGIRTRLVAHLSFRGLHSGTVQLCLHGRVGRFTAQHVEAVRALTPILSLAYSSVSAKPREPVEDYDLTARQAQIARYVRDGYQNKEIAALLQLSPHTVRNQLARIFKKLQVPTRGALAAWASRSL